MARAGNQALEKAMEPQQQAGFKMESLAINLGKYIGRTAACFSLNL